MYNFKGIDFTENAIKKVKELIPFYRKTTLRLYIDGKGCDGFYYGVSFDQKKEDDHEYQFDGFSLFIDTETHLFCDQSSIDWIDDERGAGFLVSNPNHNKFRGKFFKRKNWKETLEKAYLASH